MDKAADNVFVSLLHKLQELPLKYATICISKNNEQQFGKGVKTKKNVKKL